MHSLADVIRATSDSKYGTPAQFDYALVCGVPLDELRLMLVSGATELAQDELGTHPEGVVQALLERREEILDSVMHQVHERQARAIWRSFIMIDPGDDEHPPIVLYRDTRTADDCGAF